MGGLGLTIFPRYHIKLCKYNVNKHKIFLPAAPWRNSRGQEKHPLHIWLGTGAGEAQKAPKHMELFLEAAAHSHGPKEAVMSGAVLRWRLLAKV